MSIKFLFNVPLHKSFWVMHASICPLYHLSSCPVLCQSLLARFEVENFYWYFTYLCNWCLWNSWLGKEHSSIGTHLSSSHLISYYEVRNQIEWNDQCCLFWPFSYSDHHPSKRWNPPKQDVFLLCHSSRCFRLGKSLPLLLEYLRRYYWLYKDICIHIHLFQFGESVQYFYSWKANPKQFT